MTAKERHKIKLLEYLANPENDFPLRQDYADILGIKIPTLYNHFSPDDFTEIENEAFEIRKKKTVRERIEVYKALYTEAKKGNVKAIKEYLDRTEGRVVDRKEIDVGKNTIMAALQAIEQVRGEKE